MLFGMGRPHWYTDEMAAADAMALDAHWRKAGELREGDDARAIREVLRRRGLDRVCHVTRAELLPQIATDDGLFSSYALSYLKGKNIVTSSYLSRDRAGWSKAFIFYGFWAQWWFCDRFDDLVILVIDAEAVCLQTGALFAPDQVSAPLMMSQQALPAAARADILESCFDGSEPRRFAEIASGRVLLPSITEVVFPDAHARDLWWPRFEAAASKADSECRAAPVVGSSGRFRFPDDYPSRRRSV
jgi:hypothetical protein